MFKRDSMWLGLVVGFLVPLALFGIIFTIRHFAGRFALDKAAFVSVALNIVPIRYYFISARMERTGRGVLAMTVILIIVLTMMHL